MNYSKNLRKAAITRRVMTLCVIVAEISLVVGGVFGYALKTHITACTEEKEELHMSESLEGD